MSIGPRPIVTAAFSTLNSSISPLTHASFPLFEVSNMRRRTHVMDQRNGIMALPQPITSMHASVEPHQPCIVCLSSHDSRTSGNTPLYWSLDGVGNRSAGQVEEALEMWLRFGVGGRSHNRNAGEVLILGMWRSRTGFSTLFKCGLVAMNDLDNGAILLMRRRWGSS